MFFINASSLVCILNNSAMASAFYASDIWHCSYHKWTLSVLDCRVLVGSRPHSSLRQAMLEYGERRGFSDRFEGCASTVTTALGQVCGEAIACCALVTSCG